MNPWLIFLILLNLYFLLVFLLVRTGWMQRLNMSLFGPALMIKTQRGRSLLDWFARARGFFRGSAAIGTWVTAVFMFLMTLVLVVQIFFIFRIPVEQAPSPALIIGIPGINPIIPVGFGIIALIFAVVVHEFSHGILARCYDLKVKTMGLLFFIVPVGAFVEPDEDELKAAPRKARVHVFAAGVISNLFFALLFAVLFSAVIMPKAVPVEGAPIQTVVQDGPAWNASLEPGMIIVHVDNQSVARVDDFSRYIESISHGTWINVTVRGEPGPRAIQSTRCIALYDADSCLLGRPRDPANQTLAFDRTVIGISLYDNAATQAMLVDPFGSLIGFLRYLSLPFEALDGHFPLGGVYLQFYETPFDAGTFWFLANLVYWLFWIDLMLGLTNALPIVPLDGGHMFRDFLGGALDKIVPHKTPERRDAIVKRVSIVLALGLLALVLLQFLGPWIAALFQGRLA